MQPMNRWDFKINIKQFLSDNETDEEAERIGPLIAAELRKAAPFKESFDDDTGAAWARDIERAKTLEHADTYRVWLGCRGDKV